MTTPSITPRHHIRARLGHSHNAAPRRTSLAIQLSRAIALMGLGIAPAAWAQQAGAPSLGEVTVRSATEASPLAAPASTGALGSAAVLDTPFSIQVISAENLQDRQANSLESVFARDASVTALGNTYSNFGDTITVRGLQLDYTDSYKINGMPVNNFSGQLPLEAFEQVELLKGLSGFMYGFGQPGGIVNYVTKKPTEQRLLSIGAGLRSQGIFSQHLDAGGRVGANDRFGYRINLANEQGDIPQDDGRIKRRTLAASFDARLTSALTLTADFILNDRRIDNPPAPYFNNYMDAGDALPRTARGDINFGLRGAFEDHENQIALLGATWKIAPDWTARLDVGQTKNDTRWIKSLADLLNTDGDYEVYAYDQAFKVQFASARAMVEGKVKTGSVTHELTAGLSSQRQNAYRSDETSFYGLAGSGNLFNPVPIYYSSQMPYVDLQKSYYVNQSSVFVSDRIEFSPQWTLLAGVRHNRYEAADIWSDWAIYKKDVNTPTVALMYKPAPNATVYGSFVKGLEQGGTVGEQYANANELLPPLESKQYEAGVKIDGAHWSTSAALFRIERGAEYGNADNVYVQDGQERHQGLEINGVLRVSPSVDISASAMWLDAKYKKTDHASGLDGKRVEAAPRFQAVLEMAYKMAAVPGLRFTAGMRHIGKQALDADNIWTLSDVTLFDLGAQYRTHVGGHGLTVRAGITNLANKAYWATEGWGGLRIGEPRSFAVSAQLDF